MKNKKSSAATALEFLRKEILFSNRFPEGSHIVEAEIAEQLGCSRAPVREAIKELVSTGLLTSIPNKGTFVVTISEEEMHELFTIRCMLEGWILETLIMDDVLQPEHFDQLITIVDSMVAACRQDIDQQQKVLKVTMYDLELHTFLWELSHKKWTIEILTSLYYKLFIAMTKDYYLTGDIEEHARMHYELIDYLRKGHVEKTKRALREHIGMMKLERSSKCFLATPPSLTV